jgi:hypothetical protein
MVPLLEQPANAAARIAAALAVIRTRRFMTTLLSSSLFFIAFRDASTVAARAAHNHRPAG